MEGKGKGGEDLSDVHALAAGQTPQVELADLEEQGGEEEGRMRRGRGRGRAGRVGKASVMRTRSLPARPTRLGLPT